MLRLIKRDAAYADGYREYCRELYDAGVPYFRPIGTALIDGSWFERTKDWYAKKEAGLVKGQPVSFHYWALDGERFIG